MTSLYAALQEYKQALKALGEAAGKVGKELEIIGGIGEAGMWEKGKIENGVRDCDGVCKGCERGEAVVEGVWKKVGGLMVGDGEDGGNVGEEKVGSLVREWEEVERRWKKKGKKDGRWGERMAEVDAEVRRVLGGVSDGLGSLVGGVVGELGGVGSVLVEQVGRDLVGKKLGGKSLMDDGRVSKTSSVTVDFEDIEALKAEGTREDLDRLTERLGRAKVDVGNVVGSPVTPPASPAEPVLQRMMAEFNFRGEEGELNFRTGDVIQVIEKNDSGWWTGIVRNQKGFFPSNYTRPLGDDEETRFVRNMQERQKILKGARRHNRSHSAPEAVAQMGRLI